jgi:hypothetical protein
MLDTLLDQRKVVLAIAFLIVFPLYLLGLAIYRLYLSPIAKFPGPKLAAATYLFEGYYDVAKRGKYTFKIRDLHSEYGQTHPNSSTSGRAGTISLTSMSKDRLFESALLSCILTIPTITTASINGKAGGRRTPST